MGRILGWALLLALGAAVAGATPAQGRKAVRESAEATLLVKGTVDIAADGAVLGYRLDQAGALPASVRELIERTVPHWRFEPVALDPGTTHGRASMRLRLVAKRLDADRFTVGIRGAQFGREDADDWIRAERMPPPAYPDRALRARVGGTVRASIPPTAAGRWAAWSRR